MPWMTMSARRPHTFVPPEAGELAARFRKTAERLRGAGSDLRSVSSAFEGTWQGRSHERFVLDFGHRPGQMESAAEWLEMAARELERTEVTVWETEEQELWVPETAGR